MKLIDEYNSSLIKILTGSRLKCQQERLGIEPKKAPTIC